ncbi:MAG TPA: MATE family efflux transporter [Xanthomonadaceae bacterium]|jgi:putative MATE family efflux protein|nr:MATE family efflux transporter [Xanthomonadaceae bacterium]
MKDLTQGPIVRLLLTVAGTFMVSMIANQLFSLVSIYWVGKLGAHAQAAVILASNPIMIVLAMAPIVSSGAGVLIAQAVGAKDRDRASLIFNEAFGVSLVATTLISGFLWANRSAFGAALTSDHETVAMFALYFRWVVPAMVMQVPMAILGAGLGGTGDIRTSMFFQTGAVILRLIVTPFLLFGWLGVPRLGVEGAGLAAFLVTAVSMIGLLRYFFRANSYLKLHPRLWFVRPRTLWPVLKIGLPTGLEFGVLGFYMLMVTLLLRPFGPDEQAAFGVGQRLLMTGILPLTALAGAASVLASQNYGARLGHRVRESFTATTVLGLTLTPILFAICQIFPHWVCGIFSDDPGVIEGSVRFLRITSFSLFPASVVFASFAVLSGLGNTRASLITAATHAALVLSTAYILAQVRGFNPDWLWELMVAAAFLEMFMALYFVRAEFRKRLTLVEAQPVMALPEAQ